MSLRYLLVMFGLVALASGTRLLSADEGPTAFPPAPCGYKDCVTYSCKLVPETKQIKKTVYEVQEVPFCLKKLPPLCSLLHHHGCDECEVCPECQCPRYKKVLVKKEVVCKEICGTKCVIEEHHHRVPCCVCEPCQQP